MKHPSILKIAALSLAAATAMASGAHASSHREAPFVTEHPRVDGTDFYLFRSYEPGREGFATFIANYNPLQDAYGGPNYFDLDPAAVYRIHVDNDGDSLEDIGFEFTFDQVLKGLAIPVGPDGTLVAVPLKNIGGIGTVFPPQSDPNLNVSEVFQVKVLTPAGAALLTNAATGSTLFDKPADNVGLKSISDYDAYAADFVYDATIPGCGAGKVFVGQRREGFSVNLGEIFDLVNVGDPLGDPDGENSATQYKNVTTLALEVPISCLTLGGSGTVIGAWTTATLPRVRVLSDAPTFEDPATYGTVQVQVSRLGMPLVNEVVIGLPDKDAFNASHPKNDLDFATYVTNPTLPELLEILFGAAGVQAPNNFPRNDLLAAFVTGIAGINEFGFGEMVRLDTATAVTPTDSQSNLGVVGGDSAGFPNGRRPGDDVVDIELRVAMGLLCHLSLGLCDPADAPSGLLPFTDGALVDASQFQGAFPYLRTPVAGSPNAENGIGEK